MGLCAAPARAGANIIAINTLVLPVVRCNLCKEHYTGCKNTLGKPQKHKRQQQQQQQKKMVVARSSVQPRALGGAADGILEQASDSLGPLRAQVAEQETAQSVAVQNARS